MITSYFNSEVILSICRLFYMISVEMNFCAVEAETPLVCHLVYLLGYEEVDEVRILAVCALTSL